MAGNIFDQFDSAAQPTPAAAPKNIFDQFDDQGAVEDVASRTPQDAPKGMLATAWEKVRGKHDDQYKDVPAFNNTDASVSDGVKGPVFLGMLGGANDAALGDIIQRSLGSKFVRRFKDANGYELIEHTATKDGQPTLAYVSKPGLDLEGVVRGGVGAIPYAVGGAAGTLAKIGSIPLRAAWQAGISGGTNVAGQVAQKAAGSDQDFDKTQAALATVLGGAGEVIPSKIMAPVFGGAAGLAATYDPDNNGVSVGGTATGAAVGFAAQSLARRMLRMNPSQWVKSDGTLTPRAQEVATAAGIPLNDLKGAIAQDWAKVMAATRDPAQAMVSAESRNGIPMTLGQRNKDYQQLVLEDQMRAGQKGIPAQQEIKRFDDMQRAQYRVRLHERPEGQSACFRQTD
jgi:hypothetical protein